MKLRAATVLVLSALTSAFAFSGPASAQEAAIKGSIAISQLHSNSDIGLDRRLVSTAFGGHYRKYFGGIAIQGEVNMVTRGARTQDKTETVKLQYLELPVLLVVPMNAGRFQVYGFGGPLLTLETRCRYIVEEEGLKTNFGCDQSTNAIFDRNPLDYGATAGAGVSHPLAGGRLMLEARHTWGMRSIYDGPDPDIEVRNRSILLTIGYTLQLDLDERR